MGELPLFHYVCPMWQHRYRLSRVELNKKSVVCVERELQKDESKWAAQRAVDAQIRQLKEKRYLNNCAASKRLQQRRVLVISLLQIYIMVRKQVPPFILYCTFYSV